ncbi:MAG: diaminopimelate epimerase [Bacillota bacterium]|nr:diaminopimelate epimerase [Bacillota bacterium]
MVEEELRGIAAPVAFWKMAGCGNDFVVIDNREERIPERAKGAFARKVCTPHLSLGADGVMLIESSCTCHLRMRLFNPDGSEGEMCGNGARCTALVAWRRGLAPPRMTMETQAGAVEAVVQPGSVAIHMQAGPAEAIPLSEALRMEEVFSLREAVRAFFVPAGVPHLVIPLADPGLVDRLDVDDVGRKIRFGGRFPRGANVDIVAREEGGVKVRTYERGVERETYACGTGAISAALVAEMLGWVTSPVTVRTRGGRLVVSREAGSETGVWLKGPVVTIACGYLFGPAWQPDPSQSDGGEWSWCAS